MHVSPAITNEVLPPYIVSRMRFDGDVGGLEISLRGRRGHTYENKTLFIFKKSVNARKV